MARKQRRKAIKEQTPQTPDIKIGTKFGGNEVVSINHNTVTIKNFLGKVYYESMWVVERVFTFINTTDVQESEMIMLHEDTITKYIKN